MAGISHTNSREHPIVIYRECVMKHHQNSALDAVGCNGFQPTADPNDVHCVVCGCERGYHRQIVLAPGATCNLSALPPPPPPMNPPPIIGTLSGGEFRKMVSEQRAKERPFSFKSWEETRPNSFAGSGSGGGEGSSGNRAVETDRNAPPENADTKIRLKLNEAQKKRATEFMEEWQWQLVPALELQKLCDEIGVPIKNFRWWIDRTKRRMKKNGELPK